MSEAACLDKTEAEKFCVEQLSFTQIPHQTKLFLNYLAAPKNLPQFYPNAVNNFDELTEKADEVLANYQTDRETLCNALETLNKSYGASDETLKNIELLRDNKTLAIVTGQQAGLFSGALYTIYKALSTIKLAEKLLQQGIQAVPVFWIASEDHDFAEVAKTFVLNRENALAEIAIDETIHAESLPVGKVVLDERINETLTKLFDELPKTEFSAELRKFLTESYAPKTDFASAFGKFLTKILGKFGIIFFDPLDSELKKLAAPILTKAVEKSEEIVSALVARSKELEKSGYHAQILVEKDSFPMFYFDENGKRLKFKIKNEKFKVAEREFSKSELAQFAAENPSRLSPNATFRAVVQDWILPTLCYFGGAAEVAYFAQVAQVYRILERPNTSVFHRASLSIVEPRERRTMKKYDLQLTDFFSKKDEVFATVVEKFLNSDTAKMFAEVEDEINISLRRLDESLMHSAPTLAESLARRRPRFSYHLNALRKKFHREEIQKNAVVGKQIEDVFNSLYPHDGLQERTLNVTYFLNRHGNYFVDWLYEAIEIESKEHHILFL